MLRQGRYSQWETCTRTKAFYGEGSLYRRRMGVIAVREMARHRYRQSQYAGLTRLQLDEVGRERQMQRQGAWRAEALAEGSVELAQAMVPQALVLARGG